MKKSRHETRVKNFLFKSTFFFKSRMFIFINIFARKLLITCISRKIIINIKLLLLLILRIYELIMK